MSWSNRRVVVTGGAGFIGSHLVDALVERGSEVTVVDNFSTGRAENLAASGAFELLRASVLEEHRLRRAVRGADTVFHLSAVLGVRRSWEEPVRVIHENVRGTEAVLRAAAEAGVGRVVLASSSEVYGDGTPPYSESDPPSPRTGYAAAKLVEEKIAEGFHHETGIRTVSLRYFNAYGPRQEASAYGFVAGIFARRASMGLPPIVHGDGSQTRDFTHVSDVVEATLAAAERAGDCDVLNVGTGVETSIADLAKAIVHAAGRPDLAPVFAPPRRDEVRRRVADVSRVRRALAWAPKRSLAEGLSTLRPAGLSAPVSVPA